MEMRGVFALNPLRSGAVGARVRDVVRDVIHQVAPDEIPLLDGLARFDDERAVTMLARGRKRREPLGFGLDEVAVLLSPVVWVALESGLLDPNPLDFPV